MRSYPEITWFGFDRRDGTLLFYNFVNSVCNPEKVLLDFGAGRAEFFENDPCKFRVGARVLKTKVKKVIAVDVDTAVFQNSTVDEAYVLDKDGRIPLPDSSVDIVLADWVFEHLCDPQLTAAEFHRILRPSGIVCARTPNKYGYIALGANIIPKSLHDAVLGLLQPSRKSIDVFPKYYQANTVSDLKRAFPTEQFDLLTFCMDASPSYTGKDGFFFQAFAFLQSCTPSPFKSVRLVFARKRTV